MTVLGLFVGPVIDRFDVRRLLLVTESLLILASGTLAVLTLTGAVALWHVYVIAIFQGVVLVFGNPARHTLVFRIVGEADLPNAVALGSALGTTARIVGPALGGLVVAFAGTGVAFAVNSASYVAVVVALLAMRVADLRHTCRPRCRPGSGAAPRDALVRPPLAPRRGGVLRRAGAEHALVQLRRVAPAAGREDARRRCRRVRSHGRGLRGRRSLRRALPRHPRQGASPPAAGGRRRFGVVELALAMQDDLAPICGLLFLAGVFYILWGANALASLQLSAPEHLRGQAASLYMFAFLGGAPLGGLLAGWLTSQGGTQLAFAVAGTAALLVAIAGFAALSVRVEGDLNASHA